MSIQHHPGDDLLLAHATGQLPFGPSLVLASHIEGCPRCQSHLQLLECAGGALLEALPAATLRADAWERTLQAIDTARGTPAPPVPVQGPPPLPAGAAWPRALTGCVIGRWRWVAPGMHYSRVQAPQDASTHLFLLRIAAGKYLPQHTHSGREFTQVLHGSFHDGRAQFAAGDFDATDQRVHHQPVVQAGGACICLASVEGRVLFDGFVARHLGALMGM